MGLEDAAEDIERRLSIMTDAVERAYEKSDKDNSVLKIFLAPEFFFRWKVCLDCSEIHILKVQAVANIIQLINTSLIDRMVRTNSSRTGWREIATPYATSSRVSRT